MLVERKRLLRTSTENNPTIINLDTSIRAMKMNVDVTLDRTLQGLLITKADLDREASRFSRRINEAPRQERQFVSIARQQEIKSGLYLLLLQKREENAITLAATANNAKIIDDAFVISSPCKVRSRVTSTFIFIARILVYRFIIVGLFSVEVRNRRLRSTSISL